MHKLKNKILLCFICFILIPVVSAGIITYNIASKSLNERNKETMLSEIKRIGIAVDEKLKIFDRYSKLLVFDAGVQKLIAQNDFDSNSNSYWYAKKQLNQYFSTYFNDPYLLSLGIFKPLTGMYTYADSINKSEEAARDEKWFKTACSEKGKCNWEMEKDYIVVSRLLRDTAYAYTWKPLGVLFIAISNSIFIDEFDDLNPQTDTFVLSDKGEVLLKNEQNISFQNKLDPQAFVKQSDVVQQDNAFVAYYQIEELNYYVVQIKSYDYAFTELKNILLYIIFSCLCCLIALFILLNLIIKRITKPLSDLNSAMSQVEKGDFDVQLKITTKDEVGTITKNFIIMSKQLKQLFVEAVENEKNKKRAEIRALQYQINPHFLYNSLNSIRIIALMRNITPVAEAITSLSRLMQNAIGKFGNIVTLDSELNTLKDFVLIQNIRFNNRITLKTEISPNCVECLLPNFILQPIVENSIFHGIQPTSKPGVVMVKAVKENDTLIILIKDNGIGMTDQCLIQLKKDLCTQTNNIGINNVNQRLKMIYGTEYGLSISSDRNGGTTVTITLPYTDEKREESF